MLIFFTPSVLHVHSIAHSERDDTQMRNEGGTKGKQGNGVVNPAIGKGEAGHSLPYTTTLPSSG
jgi:hypothetical protein